MAVDARWTSDMPGLYDRLLGPVLFAPFAEVLADRVAAVEPRSVLEVAAGTGILTRALVERLAGRAAVDATDLNEEMVAAGERAVPQARWRQADAMALPFADESFDAVACAFGAMFFPDKPAAFAEMMRVLLPGGRVLLTIWDRVEESPLTAAVVDAVSKVLPDDPPDFVRRVPHGYVDRGRISADLVAGGLVSPSIDAVSVTTHARSARALAEGFCLGTPLRFGLAERGDLHELADAVIEQVQHDLGDGPLEDRMGAFVVAAQRPS